MLECFEYQEGNELSDKFKQSMANTLTTCRAKLAKFQKKIKGNKRSFIEDKIHKMDAVKHSIKELSQKADLYLELAAWVSRNSRSKDQTISLVTIQGGEINPNGGHFHNQKLNSYNGIDLDLVFSSESYGPRDERVNILIDLCTHSQVLCKRNLEVQLFKFWDKIIMKSNTVWEFTPTNNTVRLCTRKHRLKGRNGRKINFRYLFNY